MASLPLISGKERIVSMTVLETPAKRNQLEKDYQRWSLRHTFRSDIKARTTFRKGTKYRYKYLRRKSSTGGGMAVEVEEVGAEGLGTHAADDYADAAMAGARALTESEIEDIDLELSGTSRRAAIGDALPALLDCGTSSSGLRGSHGQICSTEARR